MPNLSRFRVTLLAVFLLACGAQPTVVPVPFVTPTNDASRAQVTVVPTTTSSASSTTAPRYKDLPQGLTPEGFYFLGDPNAPVTLNDYSDFLCSVCHQYALTVEPDIIEKYVRPGKVKLVFRDVLDFGERSERASEAAACAGKQGRFWYMHELLYARQPDIFGASGADQLVALMKQFAAKLDGLDQSAFAQCINERATLPILQAADQDRRKRGIIVRPVFEIDDQRIVGFRSVEAMSAELDKALASK